MLISTGVVALLIESFRNVTWFNLFCHFTKIYNDNIFFILSASRSEHKTLMNHQLLSLLQALIHSTYIMHWVPSIHEKKINMQGLQPLRVSVWAVAVDAGQHQWSTPLAWLFWGINKQHWIASLSHPWGLWNYAQWVPKTPRWTSDELLLSCAALPVLISQHSSFQTILVTALHSVTSARHLSSSR